MAEHDYGDSSVANLIAAQSELNIYRSARLERLSADWCRRSWSEIMSATEAYTEALLDESGNRRQRTTVNYMRLAADAAAERMRPEEPSFEENVVTDRHPVVRRDVMWRSVPEHNPNRHPSRIEPEWCDGWEDMMERNQAAIAGRPQPL